jgi:HPt (histidine-containing phosphotransfer) domain-containing protein
LAIEREKCLESGMDGFIGKPFSRNDVEKILSKYLTGKTKILDSNSTFVQQCLSGILEDGALASLVSIENDGESDFIRTTLNLYFQQAEPIIANLEKSLVAKNSIELQKQAHFLRGSSGTIGLLGIFGLCADLEENAASEDWEFIEQTLKSLKEEYESSKQTIEDLFEGKAATKKVRGN